MDTPLRADELLLTARERAAEGSWQGVRNLLRDRDEVDHRPELMLLLGEAAYRIGAPAEAHACFERAVPLLQARGDRVALRRTVNRQGACLFELGRLSEAELLFERALELGRRDGDALLMAQATNNLGMIADIRGRREEALALYHLAVPAYQRLGHELGLAESYHNIAISFRRLGDLEQADESERRAIRYAARVPDRRLAAMARVGRAEVLLQKGEHELAEAASRQAMMVFRELPDPAREADAARLCGLACVAAGRVEEAGKSFARAIDLARAHGNALIEAESLAARADVARVGGDVAGALQDARAALRLFEALQAQGEAERLREWIRDHLDARH